MPFKKIQVELLQTQTHYTEVACDKCSKPLEKQFITDPRSLQYDNALVLTLDGGYGMFLDDLDRDGTRFNEVFDAILCHDCAHILAAWLGKDPSYWHGHEAGYPPHAGHEAVSIKDDPSKLQQDELF